MKRQLLALALLAAGPISALAQYQLPNSDFESDFVVAYKSTKIGAKKTLSEPIGWHGYATLESSYEKLSSKVRVGDKLTPSTDVRTENNSTGSKKCVCITSNSPIVGTVANGVMTTGRIYNKSDDPNNAAENYNCSDPSFNISSKEESKITYPNNRSYAQPFTGKPDKFTVWVNFCPKKQEGYASVNAVIHTNARYQDPEEADKYKAVKVAAAKNDAIANYNNWQKLEIDFDYSVGNENNVPAYILVSFTTNKTPGGGSDGDRLYVDDIAMVYYNDLKTLTYGTGSDAQDLLAKAGKAVGNVVSIDASDLFYDKNLVKYEKKGQGANITEETYDPTTCILTIKVKANDISVNAQNYTIYKVQFKKPITISDDQNVITTKDDNAKVIMTRTFKKGWNTICLPFSTTAEALGATKVQKLTNCTNDLINFQSVEGGNMKWNTPYLIYFNEGKAFTSENPFIFAGKVADSNQSTGVLFSPIMMIGNYKANFSMKGNYGVVDQDGVQRIMSGGEGATLGPCRAYFQTSKAGANGMLISFDGQTTGITSAELNAEGAAEDAPIYNLQGVRVNHLTKGVYIKGGKKIIVK